MIEQRQVRVRLKPRGKYSKLLVIPRWWLKLNGDPEAVDMTLSLSVIGIQPVRREEPEKHEVARGKEA
jgi:hypothetical protein